MNDKNRVNFFDPEYIRAANEKQRIQALKDWYERKEKEVHQRLEEEKERNRRSMEESLRERAHKLRKANEENEFHLKGIEQQLKEMEDQKQQKTSSARASKRAKNLNSKKEHMKKKHLGRGLATLLTEYDSVAFHADSAEGKEKGIVVELEIAQLDPGNYQPRHHFDQESLKTLAESINQKGILQPILIRGASDGKYFIVAGERRYRAAKLAGLTKVPVIILNISDKEAAEIALIENVQREDLTPIEEAKGYRALIGEYNYTHEALATTIGKSRSYVTNIVRLMDLPGKVQDMIDDERLSFSHARLLCDIQQPEKVAEAIINKNLSVRATEQLIARQKDKKQTYKAKKDMSEEDIKNIREIEKQLKSILNIKTKITPRGASGRLTFYYKNLEDLDKILQVISRMGQRH